MSDNSDFYVKFGSNAGVFARQLKKDLEPARAEINSFITLLDTLKTKQGETSRGGGGGGGGGGRKPPPGGPPAPGDPASRTPATADPIGGGLNLKKLNDELLTASTEIGEITRGLAGVYRLLDNIIPAIKADVDAQREHRNRSDAQKDRIARGDNVLIPSEQQKLERAAAKAAASIPGSNSAHILQTPTTPAANTTTTPATPASSISQVSKVEIDQAGFDRIVNKLEEIKASINEFHRSGRPSEHDTEGAKSGGSGTAASSEASQIAALQAEIAKETAKLAAGDKAVKEQLAEVATLIAQRKAAGSSEEELAPLRQAHGALAANARRDEREETGKTKTEQSQEAKAAFREEQKHLNGLTREQYDQRIQDFKNISEPTPEGKRGNKEHLREVADSYSRLSASEGKLDLVVPHNTKSTMKDLVDGIERARKVFTEEFAGAIPESLKVGSKPRGPDTISQSVAALQARVNVTPEQLAEERAARERLRIPYLSGNLPKDATLRALEQLGGKGVAVEGERDRFKINSEFSNQANVVPGKDLRFPTGTPRDLYTMNSGAVNSPPGMVKDGAYHDAYGFQENTDLLATRARQRAADLMREDPTYNPLEIKEHENIKGSGPEAKQAQTVLRDVKRAYNEIDALGAEYAKIADGIKANRAFITAEYHRIDSKDHPLNPHERAQAEANIVTARKSLESNQRNIEDSRFTPYLDIFDKGAYHGARQQRDGLRAQQFDAAEERRYQKPAYVNDALAQALAGGRTGLRTRDTIHPIPGVRADGEKLGFIDDQRNPKELKPINRQLRRVNYGLQEEGELRRRMDLGEEGLEVRIQEVIKRTDTAATKLLNRIQEKFKTSPSFQAVTGRAIDLNDENAAVSQEKRDQGRRDTESGAWVTEARERKEQRKQRRADLRAEAAGESGDTPDESSTSGAGGGGKPPKPPTASAAGDGESGEINYLRLVVERLTEIQTLVRNGIKVTHTHKQGAEPKAKAKAETEGGAAAASAAKKAASDTRFKAYAEPTKEERDLLRAGQGGDERALVKAAGLQEDRRQALLAASPGQQERSIGAAQKAARQEDAERTRQARAASEAERAQARSVQYLAAAQEHMDEAARKELATLRELTAAGASATEVNLQLARAYNAVNSAMAKNTGADGNERRKVAQAVLSDANMAPDGKGGTKKGPSFGQNEMRDIAHSAAALNGFKTVDEAMAKQVPPGGVFGGQSIWAKQMFGNSGFWGKVMQSTGGFLVRDFTQGFVYGMIGGLQSVVKEAIQAESTFIRVSDSLAQTGRSVGSLRTDLQGISSDYGTQLNDVYKVAAGLSGMFTSTKDIASATRVVSQLELISGGALSATEAMGSLSSITAAYSDQLNNSADGMQHVGDVMTVIQNRLGVNLEVTSEGVGALSGLAKQLNLTLEQSGVYVGQISKLTNQTGAASADQLARIMATMQSGHGRTALIRELPKASGIQDQLNKNDYGGALTTLMKNWDSLTAAQQRNLTMALGGTRQARAFAALMNNTSKVLDTVRAATDAHGEAQKRADAISGQLNAEISKLGSNLQNLALVLVRSGLLDFMGLLLKVTNDVLSTLGELGSKLTDALDSNPITSSIKSIVLGLLGMGLALKVAGKAYAGFKATIAAMPTVAAKEEAAGPKVSMVDRFLDAPAGLGGRFGRVADRMDEKRGIPVGVAEREGGAHAATSPGVLEQVLGGGGASGGGAHRAAEVEKAAAAERVVSAEKAATGIGSLAREEEVLARTRTTGIGAMSKASRFLEKDLSNLSMAMNGVAGMGVAASAVLTVAGGLIALALAGLSKAHQQAADDKQLIDSLYDNRGNSKTSSDAPPEPSYQGPLNAKYQEQEAANSGVGNLLTRRLGEWWSHPLAGSATGQRLDDRDMGVIDRIPEGARIDKLGTQIDSRMNSFMAPGKQSGFFQGGLGILENSGLIKKIEGPRITLKGVDKAGEEINKKIADERTRIQNDGSMSDQQKLTALAQLEHMALVANDHVTSLALQAEGIAKIDILTPDQHAKVSEASALFASLAQGGGGFNTKSKNPAVQDALATIVDRTGANKDSRIGKDLAAIDSGKLNKPQIIAKQGDIIDEQITQLSKALKYDNKHGTLPDIATLDAHQKQLEALMQEKATNTQQHIDAFMELSTALSDAAFADGNYKLGADTANKGLRQFSQGRDRANETPLAQATNDATQRARAEAIAANVAKGKNASLLTSKATAQGAARNAQLDEQIAHNEYDAMVAQQRAGKGMGPSVQAIADKKNAWLATQRTLANTAQDANIAAMTAAAAGIWNGVASAGAQENIAMQQLAYAKQNFAAGSAEVLNATAAAKNSHKATIQAQDQVAQATRDAALASIPQGNTLAVAGAQVSNAKAALAAAAKYGRNSTEYQGALAQLYSTQQNAMQAQNSVRAAQLQLAEAYATARGDVVGAARAGEAVARAQLQAALRASGGANSPDVLAARASVVQSHAATRDAVLQDHLATIDFNLQMNRITSSSAIQAMQQILDTSKLTKQERYDLMIRIKDMKQQLSSGPWNFGNIALPTPYEVRRYVAEQKKGGAGAMSTATNATLDANQSGLGGQTARVTTVTHNNNSTIQINGADVAKVRRIIQDVLGSSVNTRTAQGRRR